MSDFLTRLAERAVGAAPPAIDPLVRSRYEAAHDLVSEETTAAVAPWTGPAVAPSPPHPEPALPGAVAPPPAPAPRRGRRRSGPSTPVRVEENRALADPPVERAEAPVRRERAPVARDLPAAQDSFVEPSTSPLPAQRAVGAAAVEPAPSRAEEPLDDGETLAPLVPTARRRDGRADAELPPAVRTVARPEGVRERPSGDSGEAVATPVPARAPEHARAESSLLVPTRPPETLEPRSARRLQPAAPGPVHVTIGRVEVVAPPTPAVAPPAPRQQAPRLSLDEYLRTRGGLGR